MGIRPPGASGCKKDHVVEEPKRLIARLMDDGLVLLDKAID